MQRTASIRRCEQRACPSYRDARGQPPYSARTGERLQREQRQPDRGRTRGRQQGHVRSARHGRADLRAGWRIGIINILLVSVTERTREIGIRMAVGARRLQVLLQFRVEFVLLSVTGGVIGIVAGVLMSYLISTIAYLVDPGLAAHIGVGFAFSAEVGVFFSS